MKKNKGILVLAVIIILTMVLSLVGVIEDTLGMSIAFLFFLAFTVIVARNARKNDVKFIEYVMIIFSIMTVIVLIFSVRAFVLKRTSITYKFQVVVEKENDKKANKHSLLRSYWFPILCAFIVLFVAIWVIFIRTNNPQSVVLLADSSKTEVVEKRKVVPRAVNVPTFDIVRIKKDGMIVVAGRWLPNKGISVLVNNKIVATEQTDKNGEFVYAPKHELKPGNYTLALIGVKPKTKSTDKVFLYISDKGFENSVSLLMTPNGSKVLQSPKKLTDGDLNVSKIDYLDTGRIVVTGTALPRLRVSLSLNDEYIGYARVSDYKNFGLGADIGKLESGKEYKLNIENLEYIFLIFFVGQTT